MVASGSFTTFAGRNGWKGRIVAARTGAKYFLIPGLYVSGEFGLDATYFELSRTYYSSSNNEMAYAFCVGGEVVGYRSKIDMSARMNRSDGGNRMGIRVALATVPRS